MSKITDAFKNGKAFIAFVTGGDPSLKMTERLVVGIAEAGADIVEIGIPFSDPIAEGEVIQCANIRALKGGVSVEKIFSTVKNIRKKTAVPLVFLTYLNPVFRYGYEAFCQRCADVGVNGLIIPDMPYEEQGELKEIARANGVDLISLVSPTSEARVAEIAASADGFLYVVSSMGVTGARSEITTDLGKIIAAAHAASAVPAAVGFGISSAEQAATIATVADGVIVGSAIVKIVEAYGTKALAPVCEYVRALKGAIRGEE
ncbi:MAG: tryptophan synthase subunit alpha [Clostridiaceae bacterium]|jgi:tryptophan synthase alpha chain|nr:tryptophan synthase subunit alpha [Clostridiaceae bacterium]